MTFQQLKDALLSNAYPKADCEKRQDAVNATTYAQLIQAGIDNVKWLQKKGIVTAALLNEFPQADLNAAGIYTTTGVSLINPGPLVVIYPGASVSIQLDNQHRCEVIVLGGGLSISTNDETLAEIEAYYNSSITASSSQKSTVCCYATDESYFEIDCNLNSMVKYEGHNNAESIFFMNNSSKARIEGFQHASINCTITAATATADIITNHASTKTVIAP